MKYIIFTYKIALSNLSFKSLLLFKGNGKMSWKDLYSEVKRRKMEALNKKDVVKAVEKHGKILAISGRYEKPEKVINYMYASKKITIKPNHTMKYNLNEFDIVLIGCPGDEIPHSAFKKINEYVVFNGGWLITTDWAIRYIIEPIFPGYIRWNGKKTDDAVVKCQILDPNHPFLDGVLTELKSEKWSKKSAKAGEFRWWLENRSFPIEVLNPVAVKVLIESKEIEYKWGASPVLCYFPHGNTGGCIIHLISHAHLQKGEKKGKYASALILTNILDEKVSKRVSISRNQQGKYVSSWQQSQASENMQYQKNTYLEPWIEPTKQEEYLTPSFEESGLMGTAQILEVDENSPNFSFASKCGFCNKDFGEYIGKIYMCQSCKTPYHENCLNLTINEGTCKKCGKILLW